MDGKPGLTRRKLLEYWWVVPVGATLGTLGVMFGYAGRVLVGKRRAGAPDYRAGPRVKVADLAALPGAYDTAEFSYAGTPCIAIRLPREVPYALPAGGTHYMAFSRVCTHLGCTVNPLRDPDVAALTFNYRPDHPVLGCPCHFSVFDPLKEGESVFGKALYPLPRVRLEARGGTLYASGIEPPPNATT